MIKSIISNIVPLGKRFFTLLLRSHNSTSISILNHDIKKPLLASANLINLKIYCSNAIYVKVDSIYIPILHDNIQFDIKLPAKAKKNFIHIKSIGMLSVKKIKIQVVNNSISYDMPIQPVLIKFEKESFGIIPTWNNIKTPKIINNSIQIPSSNFKLAVETTDIKLDEITNQLNFKI